MSGSWRTKNDANKPGFGDHYHVEGHSGSSNRLPARAGFPPNDRVAGVHERNLIDLDDLEAERAPKKLRSAAPLRVKEVRLRRAEGPSDECGTWKSFDSVEGANTQLSLNSATAPQGGAYDKHDFVIVFSNGQKYEGRYDLTYGEHGDIEKHIRNFADYRKRVAAANHEKLSEKDNRQMEKVLAAIKADPPKAKSAEERMAQRKKIQHDYDTGLISAGQKAAQLKALDKDPPEDKKWAQKAVNPENKGKLRAYIQRHYGKDGFTEDGTIKKEILHDLSHNAEEPVRGEAQFALNINEPKKADPPGDPSDEKESDDTIEKHGKKYTHEGYYSVREDADVAAKKHGGYVRHVDSGIYEGSWEVMAPLTSTMILSAIAESKKEGN